MEKRKTKVYLRLSNVLKLGMQKSIPSRNKEYKQKMKKKKHSSTLQDQKG